MMCRSYINVTMEDMDSSKQNKRITNSVEKSALFLYFILLSSTSYHEFTTYTYACDRKGGMDG